MSIPRELEGRREFVTVLNLSYRLAKIQGGEADKNVLDLVFSLVKGNVLTQSKTITYQSHN